MVTLTLGLRDLAEVRFAFSPLWECVAAFRAWRDPARHAVHLPWARALDQAGARDAGWAARGPARGGSAAHAWALLDALARAPSGAIPDFLAPPPASPLARFEDEMAAARRTPPRVVAREVRAAYPVGAPTVLTRALADAGGLREAALDQLAAFWEAAVAPAWPRVAARLEAEVAFRARALALGGAAGLFDGLHPAVRFVPASGGAADSSAGGTLRVVARETYAPRLRGRGLLLVPSVFAWPDVFVAARPPWRPTLAYPARGVADLWGAAPDDAPSEGAARVATGLAALAAVAGAPRARALVRLATPQTTGELAAALGLSAAAASAHVTALWRAGVADRLRIGRRVFYGLSARGRAVLTAFEADA